MLSLTVLVLLAIFFYFRIKRVLAKARLLAQAEFQRLQSELGRLSEDVAKLKNENACLEKSAEETLALYDLTTEIRKSLDEEEIFSFFQQRLKNDLGIEECAFLKQGADLKEYAGAVLLPLKIQKDYVRYLFARGIKKDDSEKFHILAHQFLPGIKRAFLYQQVQRLSITDTLTGAFNRRHFMEKFGEELKRSRKNKLKFSYLMLDVDRFKEINDNYGHLVGDAVLRDVAKCVKENIRQIDFLGRYGGEELAIVLSETDEAQAVFAAERIRQAVEKRRFLVYDEDLKATLSIGIAAFPKDAGEADELMDKADQALYRAKELGRNRVCVF
ncbi:MAG: GGDEF domain-containing protein [Candidatus Omnitrophota bacterium]|nr:GGDEF domain-containing protein [Candidatus Omnitrophota bacterium]